MTRNDENVATELFVNLMQYKYARDIILKTLDIKADIIDQVRFENIITRKAIVEQKFPDIIISTEKACIYIENKIAAHRGLEKSQTTTYISDLLSKNKAINMIYIVPPNYQHMDQIIATKNTHDFVIIKTWDKILNSLVENELAEWNPVIYESIEYLSNLILEKPIEVKLRSEEIIIMYNVKDLAFANSLFIKTKNMLNQLKWRIEDKLQTVGEFKFSRFSWEENENERGIYFLHNSEESIYFGFNLQVDVEHSDFIFAVDILGVDVDADKLELYKQNESSDAVWFDGEWYYFKLNKYSIVTENNLEELSKQICEIIINVVNN